MPSMAGRDPDPRSRRIEVALFCVVLTACGFFLQPNGAQGGSRMALSAALVERGTVVIDEYTGTLGVDYAERDGHFYSDKAPGQPVLGAPFWAVYRLAGGEPGTVRRGSYHLGLWWQTLWTAAVPLGLLAVALRRHVREWLRPAPATAVAIAMVFGTILFPFGTLLFGHVLAALFGFWAFRLVREVVLHDDRRPRTAVLAGASAGAAIAVEYTVAIVVVVIAVALLARRPGRFGWFALGGVCPGVGLAAYHWVAFGGPLEHPYKYSVFELHHDTFAGIGVPDAGMLLSVLVGDRGMLTLTPLIAVAIAGLVVGRNRLPSIDVVVPAAIMLLYLLFASGWIDPTGGASPGPRHLLPGIPFLVVGLVEAWRRWRLVTVASAAIGTATMTLAVLGDPQLPVNDRPALRIWARQFVDGDGAATLLEPLLGRSGLVVAFVVVAWCGRWLVREHACEPADESDDDADRLPHPAVAGSG